MMALTGCMVVVGSEGLDIFIMDEKQGILVKILFSERTK